MIDDVLGLLVLAVISGVITAAGTGQEMSAQGLALIVLKAVVFLVGALVVGSFLSPRLFRAAQALRSTGVVQALSLAFCFGLAYLALKAGLAPIVGAFAAGLVLEDVHFEGLVQRGERHERDPEPLIALFVPGFFVRMGSGDIALRLPAVWLRLPPNLAHGATCLRPGPAKGIPITVGSDYAERGGLIFAGLGAQSVGNAGHRRGDYGRRGLMGWPRPWPRRPAALVQPAGPHVLTDDKRLRG